MTVAEQTGGKKISVVTFFSPHPVVWRLVMSFMRMTRGDVHLAMLSELQFFVMFAVSFAHFAAYKFTT